MRLKKFVARDPQEALALVKKELGPEAVILSTQTRELPLKGPGRRAARRVEVTAAVLQGGKEGDPQESLSWYPRPEIGDSLTLQRLAGEIRDLKVLLQERLGDWTPPRWLAAHEELWQLFSAFSRAGLHGPILQRWLRKVEESLQKPLGENPHKLKETGIKLLLEEVVTVDLWKALTKGGCRWVFHGASGVGKTSTILKLAIQAAFLKKKRVSLISLSDDRAGAADLLDTYARISDLPHQTVRDAAELKDALRAMTHMDVVLVDTPGRSPCDPALPRELNRFFAGITNVRHHMVVSATSSETHLAEALRAFYREPFGSCIVTKVDEVQELTGVFNQLSSRRLPLSFLATGPRIPEDLVPASRSRLAQLLLAPMIPEA